MGLDGGLLWRGLAHPRQAPSRPPSIKILLLTATTSWCAKNSSYLTPLVNEANFTAPYLAPPSQEFGRAMEVETRPPPSVATGTQSVYRVSVNALWQQIFLTAIQDGGECKWR
ncbi:hypothetical protein E2C01_020492 [Portunus trituberculatus]|uniref:Uncharacterized protein n=1 Tax=Portunus trituberculatus TaxID=210409 RepID=A0A5B7E3I5_PORTR|nr:hypothetical protein [Portunus trituberculatus]